MDILITHNSGSETLSVPTDESGFYKAIAEFLVKLPFPNFVIVNASGRTIEYTLEERGGTCNIQTRKNGIIFKTPSVYEEKYLTYADFISAEKKAKEARGEVKRGNDFGSYKFYSLKQEGDQIRASWGSIGGLGGMQTSRSCLYPLSMFWIKYYEKVQKGYIDNSEAYIEDKKADIESEKAVVSVPKITLPEMKKVNHLAISLWKTLMGGAVETVKRSISAAYVTQGMVDAAKKYMDELYKTTNLDDFNACVLKLCMVSPRRVFDMKLLMASSEADYQKIIDREEDLILAMESMLLKKNASGKAKSIQKDEDDPFEAVGISVTEASEKEAKEVINLLNGANLGATVYKIYKVSKPEFEKRFDKYVEANKITNTRLLWHGSRTCNWLSIIQNGLLLKPNAQITGKMFGHGIYFAPSAKKSWGYTSYHNSYWAKGSSSCAFMGVYETAYGNPHHPNRSESWNFTKSQLKNLKKDCVHAQGGTCGLANDEIIFYDEAAMVLRYLVEFH